MSTIKNDTTTDTSVSKKRGRPKKEDNDKVDIKESIFEKLNNSSTKVDADGSSEKSEEIILHLPIKFGNNSDIDVNSSVDITSTVDRKDSGDKNIFTIGDLSCNESSDDSYGVSNNKGLMDDIKKRDQTIKQLESTVSELKGLLNKYTNNSSEPVSVYRMATNLIKKIDSETSKIVDKTDIVCWWCTEQFNNRPQFLPDKYTDDVFYVFGNFCSEECAAAYNIDVDDYRVGDRHSLLIKLHNIMYPNDQIKNIVSAPPRLTLQKFGGIYDINEFRKTSKYNKIEHRFIMPPMVTMVPYIERCSQEDNRMMRLNNLDSKDGLVLKRSKPLPNSHNTLINTIGLIVKE